MLAIGVLSGAAMAQTTLRIGLAEDPDVLDPTLAHRRIQTVVATRCLLA
jgi:peptide/nickel transport system substrate-binding protein